MKTNNKYSTLIGLLCLLCTINAAGQDVEQFFKKDPFKLTGGINATMGMRSSNAEVKRYAPFSYSISGTPTISIYGISFPITIGFSDNSFNFGKSIGRIGTSPKYKWLQLHLGRSSFSFSPYTLAGQEIKGLGVTLSPGKFNLTVMKGTTVNYLSQVDSIAYGAALLPTFERKVMGAKIGVRGNKSAIELMAYKAKDQLDENIILPDSLLEELAPEENLSLGFIGNTTLVKRLSIGVNLGASAITDDLLADSINVDDSYSGLSESTLQPRRSTRLGFAGDAYAKLNLDAVTFGVKYQKVEPYYRTLGAVYMNNDFINTTFNLSIRLMKGKLVSTGSFGRQKNNLNGLRATTNERNISSVNVNFSPGQVFGCNVSYTNFSQDQSTGFYEIEDTMRFAQVTKNINIIPRLSFISESFSQTWMVSLMQFDLNNLSSFFESEANSTNRVANLSYSIKKNKSGLTLRASGNYNQVQSSLGESIKYGGTIGLSQRIKRIININLSNTYNLSYLNEVSDGFVNKIRLRLTLKIIGKHSLQFNSSYLIKTSIQRQDINEVRSTISYGVSF